MKKLAKNIFFGLIVTTSFLTTSAFAQADSSDVPPLRGTPPKLPLSFQELQPMGSPIINNISNVTQVVQPNTYTVTNSSYGQTTSAASVDCGGGVLTGGGGTCNDNSGLVAVAASQPNGNGWYVGCQSLNYQGIAATVYAVCSRN